MVEAIPKQTPPRCTVIGDNKRCECCCFSLVILSGLHERLLVSSFFSLCFFVLHVVSIAMTFRSPCPQPYADLVSCGAMEVRQGIAAFSFLLYFLTSVHCLRNLDRLDIMLDMMADVSKMEQLLVDLESFDRERRRACEILALFRSLEEASSALWKPTGIITSSSNRILGACSTAGPGAAKVVDEEAQRLLDLVHAARPSGSPQPKE